MIRRAMLLALGLGMGVAMATIPRPAVAQSSVVLWPVDPRIAPGEQASALWLENRGKTPVTLQVRAFAWRQPAGEDDYQRQDAVVASPPIAEVGPGQRQLIRVIRRTADAAGEHAYRLLIDELPPPAPHAEAGVSAQLSVQMRYSIPLFTYGSPQAAARPALTSRIEMADGKPWLAITNTGTGHARLTDLKQGGAVVRGGLVGYVLPGATMRWELPEQARLSAPIIITVNGSEQTLARSS